MTGYFANDPMLVRPDATVQANAASATLTVANSGKIQTNTGASGAIVLTLPAVANAAGTGFKFQATAAQTIELLPQSGEAIFLGGSGVVTKYALIAGVIGNFVDLYCDGAKWLIWNYSGVVTKEA